MDLDKVSCLQCGVSHVADNLNHNLGPELNLNVLEHLAKYLPTKGIKKSRLVNRKWRDGMATEFRKNFMLDAGFSYQKSIPDFISRFSPVTSTKLSFHAIWIRKPKFLDDPLFVEWMKKYGDQITELKLGNLITSSDTGVQRRKKIFSAQNIQSLLLNCFNLKVLKIVAPFYIQSSLPILFSPTEKQITLDRLQIGECNSYFSTPTVDLRGIKLQGTSRLLFEVLNCIKSIHTLSIIGLSAYNCDGGGTIELKNETHAKTVLENIQELKLVSVEFDPRPILGFSVLPAIDYCHLKNLSIKCVKLEPLNVYLKEMLTKVIHKLEEFIFDTSLDISIDMHDYAVECPKFENYFATIMDRLKVIRILGIWKWDNASLEFLKLLPALETLHITKDVSASPIRGFHQVEFLNSFTKYRFLNGNLKQLTFKCLIESSNINRILFSFPNLKYLEIDSNGYDLESLFAQITKHKNVKNLTVMLYQAIKYAYFDALYNSGVEKLQLKSETGHSFPISLNMIALSCLKSSTLSFLELVGMKISSEEYKMVMTKLSTLKDRKLFVTCINCTFCSWESELARIGNQIVK